jgi:hypothetical protein
MRSNERPILWGLLIVLIVLIFKETGYFTAGAIAFILFRLMCPIELIPPESERE